MQTHGARKLVGAWLLLGVVLWSYAQTPECRFRYSGEQLEYYWVDQMGYSHGWYPARIVGPNVEFYSGGEWWNAFQPVSATECAYRESSSSSSSYDYGEAVRRYYATQRAQDSIRRTANWQQYTYNTSNIASCGDCCNCLSDLCCCLYCFGCLRGPQNSAATSQPKNQDAGKVRDWEWHLGLAGEYTETDLELFAPLTGQDEDRRTWTSELYGVLVRDRTAVVMSLRYDRLEGDGAADALDGQGLALQFIPTYRLLKQADAGVDLDLITSLGISRTAYEQVVADSDTEDNVTAGIGLGVGRSTPLGNVNLSYVYQPSWNISGEDELTGSNRVDEHAVSTTFTASLGGGLIGVLAATWLLTPDLPGELDRDYVDGTVGLAYVQGRYRLGVAYGRTFWSDDINEWHASLEGGLTW